MKPVLLPEDADYLARAMAQECAEHELPYAARVGIAAVVLNRVEDDRYPDTAAAVLSSWEEWDAWNAFDAPLTPETVPEDREYRLCRDACRAVLDGADPTGGALHFEYLEENVVNESPYYHVVIGNTAFW